MDFSKAIMKNHSKEVEKLDSEISRCVNDPYWIKQNNQYKYGDATTQGSTIHVQFTYTIDNALMVFAELKKRYEERGWRVTVSSKDQTGAFNISLFK